MAKNTKINKLKTAGLIAVLAGALVAGGVAYKEYTKSYDAQLKKEISNMTDKEIENFINECDIALEHLQKTIDSDKTNPEQKFEARRAYKSILKQREDMQKTLSRRQKSIFHFKSGRGDR